MLVVRNPQDFKVTKNFSLHINLLILFFYKALEKDIKRKKSENATEV